MTTLADLTQPGNPIALFQAALLSAQQSANANASATGTPIVSGADINTPALQALLDAAIAWIEPYITDPNGQVASYAFNAFNVLVIDDNLLNPLPGPVTTLQGVINPNLFALSLQFYGDASQWSLIAAANSLINAFPIGMFTLTIPQPT
jgi:nucleoid-associated protein YgaU